MRPAFSVKFRFYDIPDQGTKEHCLSITPFTGDRLTAADYQNGMAKASRELQLEASRRKPVSVRVVCILQTLVAGHIDERNGPEFTYELPFVARTMAELNEDLTELLAPLPEEFHGFVRQLADEHGHASGTDEVYNLAIEMFNPLMSAVAAYERRIAAERRQQHGRST